MAGFYEDYYSTGTGMPWNQTLSWDNNTYNWTMAPSTEPPYMPGMWLHPHWEQYRDVIDNIPDSVHYALGVYITFVCGFAILGNLLVMHIFISTKALRTPPNMFVVNLALSDFIFSVINGFPLLTISSFMKKWYFGPLWCKLYAFIGGIAGFNSIQTLALISIDRFVVIAMPFYAMQAVSHKKSLLQIIGSWILATLWVVPPFFGFGNYIPEGFQTTCSFDYLTRTTSNMVFVLTMFFLGFCFPLFVIIVCYTKIVLAVASQAKMMGKTAEKMGAKTDKEKRAAKQEIRLAKIAAGTVSLFVISWAPYAAVAIGGIFGYRQIVTPYTTMVPVMAAKASAMWNPIIYALSHPKFRAQLDERFPWLLMCKDSNIDKGEDSKAGSVKVNTNPAGKKAKAARTDSVDSCESEFSESVYTSEAANTEVVVESRPAAKAARPPPRPEPPRSNTQAVANGGHSNYGPSNQGSQMTGSIRRISQSVFRHIATAIDKSIQSTHPPSGDYPGYPMSDYGGYENPAYRPPPSPHMPPARPSVYSIAGDTPHYHQPYMTPMPAQVLVPVNAGYWAPGPVINPAFSPEESQKNVAQKSSETNVNTPTPPSGQGLQAANANTPQQSNGAVPSVAPAPPSVAPAPTVHPSTQETEVQNTASVEVKKEQENPSSKTPATIDQPTTESKSSEQEEALPPPPPQETTENQTEKQNPPESNDASNPDSPPVLESIPEAPQEGVVQETPKDNPDSAGLV